MRFLGLFICRYLPYDYNVPRELKATPKTKRRQSFSQNTRTIYMHLDSHLLTLHFTCHLYNILLYISFARIECEQSLDGVHVFVAFKVRLVVAPPLAPRPAYTHAIMEKRVGYQQPMHAVSQSTPSSTYTFLNLDLLRILSTKRERERESETDRRRERDRRMERQTGRQINR